MRNFLLRRLQHVVLLRRLWMFVDVNLLRNNKNWIPGMKCLESMGKMSIYV